MASIVVAAAVETPPPTLAFTGRDSFITAGAAFALLIAGLFVVMFIGRKEDEEIVS